jgi:hypothetical protein
MITTVVGSLKVDLIPPSKETDWQTGLKRKIQQSVAYRRLTSSTEVSTG